MSITKSKLNPIGYSLLFFCIKNGLWKSGGLANVDAVVVRDVYPVS
jgi:hypothetical protein